MYQTTIHWHYDGDPKDTPAPLVIDTPLAPAVVSIDGFWRIIFKDDNDQESARYYFAKHAVQYIEAAHLP